MIYVIGVHVHVHVSICAQGGSEVGLNSFLNSFSTLVLEIGSVAELGSY